MSLKNGTKRPRIRWSLATRLASAYALCSFLGVLVVSVILYVGLVQSMDEEDDQFLDQRIHAIESLLNGAPATGGELRWEVETEWLGAHSPQVYTRILDSSGQVVIETRGMRQEVPPDLFPKPVVPGKQTTAEVRGPSGRAFRIVAAVVNAGARGQVIQAALDQSRDAEILTRYRNRLALVLAIALLLGSAAGYGLARRGIRPVEDIVATARRIGTSTLDERLDPTGLPSEIETLATTFNEMLDRLEQAFEKLSRFSADIAHELRTPLNNLRGEAEVALRRQRPADEYREVLVSSLEEIDKLSRIIDSLLFLARSQSSDMHVTATPLELGEELAKAKEFHEASAEEAGIDLTAERKTPVLAPLDRTLLQRAVGNVLSNAIAHTPRGGHIALRCGETEANAWIEIQDDGEGIPPEHLPHVFDRFYRVTPARTGNGNSGLGLSIVQAIANVHGGSVDIQSEPGCGTRVTLRFPKMTES